MNADRPLREAVRSISPVGSGHAEGGEGVEIPIAMQRVPRDLSYRRKTRSVNHPPFFYGYYQYFDKPPAFFHGPRSPLNRYGRLLLRDVRSAAKHGTRLALRRCRAPSTTNAGTGAPAVNVIRDPSAMGRRVMHSHQCSSCGRQTRSYWKLRQHLKRCPSHLAAAVGMRHASDLLNTEHHAACATTVDVLVLGNSRTTTVAQDALSRGKDFQESMTSARVPRQTGAAITPNKGGRLRDHSPS
jgi:hypothetical protein